MPSSNLSLFALKWLTGQHTELQEAFCVPIGASGPGPWSQKFMRRAALAEHEFMSQYCSSLNSKGL